MTEIWREIPEYPGYMASSQGRIRGLKGGVLKPHEQPNGYLRLMAKKSDGRRGAYVHRLVCAAFKGPPPESTSVVRHLNHGRSDNRPENLAWGTQSENIQDSKRDGRLIKTCPQGHEISGDNVKMTRRGSRRACRTCYESKMLNPRHKTHCRAGHPRTPEHTRYFGSQRQAYCYTCFKINFKKRQEKKETN